MSATATIAKTRVGVLNASYEPLATTELKRAMALVLDGKAEIVESDESRTIHALGATFSFPKVIRLLRYTKVPFTYAEEYFSQKGLLVRDKKTCGYCLGHATTHDHIIPKSRGGQDTWMNAIAACVKCNNKKDNRTPEEADMPLLFQPTVPMRIYYNSGKRRKHKKK